MITYYKVKKEDNIAVNGKMRVSYYKINNKKEILILPKEQNKDKRFYNDYNTFKKLTEKEKDNIKDFDFPVKIDDSVTDCSYMFEYCASFNQPIEIPSGVTDCHSMFWGCASFNQPIKIPSGVIVCDEMFQGCSSFNQSVEIPSSVAMCSDMFHNCTSMKSDVYCTKEQFKKLGLTKYKWENGVARFNDTVIYL